MKRGYCEKEDVPWVQENSQSITAEMRGDIGIDDHNVLGVKVAWTKWETANIEGGVIQCRNEGAQEPCMAILVYLVDVAKPCIVDDLQFSVRISQPIINNTCESLR